MNKRKLEEPSRDEQSLSKGGRPTKRLASPSVVQEQIASLHISNTSSTTSTSSSMSDLHGTLVHEYQKGTHANHAKINETLNALKVHSLSLVAICQQH